MTTVRMTVTALLLVMYVSSAVAQLDRVRPLPVPVVPVCSRDPVEAVNDKVNETFIEETRRVDEELYNDILKTQEYVELDRSEKIEGHEFTVLAPNAAKRYTDGDCSCPTVNYYYRPYRLYHAGNVWYPVGGFYSQWVKIGKCLGNHVCHKDESCPWKDKRCTQTYEYKRFFAYRIDRSTCPPKIIYSWITVSFPDYCHCPHCCTSQ